MGNVITSRSSVNTQNRILTVAILMYTYTWTSRLGERGSRLRRWIDV